MKAPIKVPSKATLRKYGLDAESWLAILGAQGWVCAICKKVPPSGRMVTDHFHMPKRDWKRWPPEKRRTYVRGITCWTCNHYYLGRGINIEKALNVVRYLQAFAVRAAPVLFLALTACEARPTAPRATMAPGPAPYVVVPKLPTCISGQPCLGCGCPAEATSCGHNPLDAGTVVCVLPRK